MTCVLFVRLDIMVSHFLVKGLQLFLLLQAAGKALKAGNVQENVVYEAQQQADHTLALTGPGGLIRHRQRGLHVSVSDRPGKQRSLLLRSWGRTAIKSKRLHLTGFTVQLLVNQSSFRAIIIVSNVQLSFEFEQQGVSCIHLKKVEQDA